MSYKEMRVLNCDGEDCNEVINIFDNKTTIQEVMNHTGWKEENGKHYCHKCGDLTQDYRIYNKTELVKVIRAKYFDDAIDIMIKKYGVMDNEEITIANKYGVEKTYKIDITPRVVKNEVSNTE